MSKPLKISGIRNITVSGRIATGASTLAEHLARALDWNFLNGGDLFREFAREQRIDIVHTSKRPDQFDIDYEERVKRLLRDKDRQVVQSHLAGFDAHEIDGVYKILVVCEDVNGEDKVDIRIDRLVNRDGKKVDEAKREVLEREQQNLDKWRRLYAKGDPDWVYWDRKYYDLVVNTYSLNALESVEVVLRALTD